MLTFTGFLDTSERSSGDGFRVKLFMNPDQLEIASLDGEFWKWDTADVDISRVKIDRFRLGLADEELFFQPDDPIAFTLKTTVDDAPARPSQPRRGWLRRRIEEAADGSTPAPAPDLFEDASSETDEAPRRKRSSHTHTWDQTMAAGVVRRRCTGCGRISIDLSQVTSAFEMTTAGH